MLIEEVARLKADERRAYLCNILKDNPLLMRSDKSWEIYKELFPEFYQMLLNAYLKFEPAEIKYRYNGEVDLSINPACWEGFNYNERLIALHSLHDELLTKQNN